MSCFVFVFLFSLNPWPFVQSFSIRTCLGSHTQLAYYYYCTTTVVLPVSSFVLFYVLLRWRCPFFRVICIIALSFLLFCMESPSEHPPDRGKKCRDVCLGIIGCKDKRKTSSWHLIGFPDGSHTESQQYRTDVYFSPRTLLTAGTFNML